MDLNLHLAYANLMSGYGKLEWGLWHELTALGVTVALSGAYSPDFVRAMHRDDQAMPAGIMLRGGPVTPWPRPESRAAITLVFGNPFKADPWLVRTTRHWLYTMTETDLMNPDWVNEINAHYERVIVPVLPLVDVLEASGVTVPIHVVPIGLDTLPPIAPALRRPANPAGRIVLGYSLGGSRKGALHTIMAFKAVFSDRPDAQLWIKMRSYDTVPNSWIWGCQDPQIQLLTGSWGETAWRRLLTLADWFVFPSRGEGYGMPPREAVLYAQTPAVVTPFLGMYDAEHWAYPVAIQRMIPAVFEADTVNAKGARWAEPSLDGLIARLAWLDEHDAEAQDCAVAGQQYLSQFTHRRAAEQVLALLERYA